MVTIENIRHFNAVVENEGVLRAAEKLFISASSITRSIKTIEDLLGTELFDRIGRTIKINGNGEEFYKQAKNVLFDFDALLVESAQRGQRLLGHYRIGASHFLCRTLLADLMVKLTEVHPSATFEIQSFESSVMMKKLHNGEVDLGITFSAKPTDILKRQQIDQGSLLIAVDKNHPLAGKPARVWTKELNNYRAIIHRPTDSIERCDNHPMFRKFGIKPNIQTFWDSDDVALQMLSNKHFWTMMPEIIVKSDKRVVGLEPPRGWVAPYDISVVWNKSRTLDELRSAVLELV